MQLKNIMTLVIKFMLITGYIGEYEFLSKHQFFKLFIKLLSAVIKMRFNFYAFFLGSSTNNLWSVFKNCGLPENEMLDETL